MCNYNDRDDRLKETVWRKGRTVSWRDPNEWRIDDCGAWIKRDKYGERNDMYGWQIDHIILDKDGGSDDIENLRPLQWKNNEARQDGPLVYKVVAVGNRNVDIEDFAKKIAEETIRRINEEYYR